MVNQRAGILGTGHSYPEGILTNADLAKMVETSDEWITTRTGIKQRRKAAPGEYTSHVRGACCAPGDRTRSFGSCRHRSASLRHRYARSDTAFDRLHRSGRTGRKQRRGDGHRGSVLGFLVRRVAGRLDDQNGPGATCGRSRRGDPDAVRRLHRSTNVRVVWRWRGRGGVGTS